MEAFYSEEKGGTFTKRKHMPGEYIWSAKTTRAEEIYYF